MHAIMPHIVGKYHSACTNRKDAVIIICLRIGHARPALIQNGEQTSPPINVISQEGVAG